eukprot:1194257-Prorocentrum_minimum.AAC.2
MFGLIREVMNFSALFRRQEWTVSCVCGMRADDGFPMIACDRCGVWQHLFCNGLQGSEPTSSWFCTTCRKGVSNKKGRGQDAALKDQMLATLQQVRRRNKRNRNQHTLKPPPA